MRERRDTPPPLAPPLACVRPRIELTRRFVAAMQARGILCVDPTEAMGSADTPLYWRRDYHLNVAGHRLVAERLNEALVGRL